MEDLTIDRLLARPRGPEEPPLLSLEFFPPKNEALAQELLLSAETIATHLRPDFVSITYGAGGGTGRLTYLYTQLLRERFDWTVMPHLTCVGHKRDELIAIAESYYRLGIRNLMALRGDPPQRVEHISTSRHPFDPHAPALQYASDLVELLHTELPELCLGVAGYPEKHPEAPTLAADIARLKAKVDAGARFVTTQLFFDNRAYFQFVEQCRQAGITVPILPGLMPAVTLAQIQRFCSFCGATLPAALAHELQALPAAEQWRAGVAWTHKQMAELIEAGAPGIHLYVLNRSQSTLSLIHALREDGMI